MSTMQFSQQQVANVVLTLGLEDWAKAVVDRMYLNAHPGVTGISL